MENSLTVMSNASKMLAEANTIQKTKELKDLALTAADWAKRKGMGEETIRYCTSYAFEAERKMGEILKATDRNKGTKGSFKGRDISGNTKVELPEDDTPTLEELGLTLKESSEAQFLAGLPDEEFDKIASGETSITKAKREQRKKETNIKSKSPKGNCSILYKGDMLEVIKTLGKFELVVTDPPYGVTEYEWDQLDTNNWLDIIIPHLQDKYNLFWFCSPRFAADIEMIFRNKGLPIQSRIVWHRRNMAMGSAAKNKFIDTWEMILHAGNRELNFPNEWSEAWFDVQTFAVPQTNFTDKKLHPTQKPEGLIQRLVEFGSYPKDHILDPFAGGGTTGIVCPNDRECVLIEKEEEYVAVIEERLGIKRQ